MMHHSSGDEDEAAPPDGQLLRRTAEAGISNVPTVGVPLFLSVTLLHAMTMAVTEDSSRGEINENHAVYESHEMANESDVRDDGDVNITDVDESGAAVAVTGVTGGQGFTTEISVTAENPKSFKRSLFKLFVPPDEWEACDRDEQEAGYVLEDVRQRLLGLCAPGRGSWKVNDSAPALKFLPLPVTPLNPESGYTSPSQTHGMIRIRRRSETAFQSTASTDEISFKVMFGNPEFEVCGNREPAARLPVNHQITIPRNCIFKIKNPDMDEAVLYYILKAELPFESFLS